MSGKTLPQLLQPNEGVFLAKTAAKKITNRTS